MIGWQAVPFIWEDDTRVTIPEIKKEIPLLRLIGQRRGFVDNILDATGAIDFLKLESFDSCASIVKILESQKNVKEAFFSFFDFLRHHFFQKNLPIPTIFFHTIRSSCSARSWINAYIEQGNSQLLSSQNIEQHEIISFHLFLLWMDPDFGLIEDIWFNDLTQLKSLFSRYIFEIGKISWETHSQWMEKEKILNQKIGDYIALCETINKLALIYSINFEGRWISLNLVSIIKENITTIIKTFEKNFPVNERISKLYDILGKTMLNFAHWIPIIWSTREEIRGGIAHIEKIQKKWYDIRISAGIVPREILDTIFLGNETFVELVGLEKIERIYGTLNEEELIKKQKLLSNFISIYNRWKDTTIQSSPQAIQDFIDGGDIKDEYQIETIHHLVLFDKNIPDSSILELLSFLITEKKENNFYYEEFRIKMLELIIKRASIHSSLYKKHNEELLNYLGSKNISHTILSYSKVYFALALYYIGIIPCTDEDLDHAQTSFFHYTNLRMKEKSQEAEEKESFFYRKLFTEKSSKFLSRDYHISSEDIRHGGELIFWEFLKRYQDENLLAIEREIGDMNTSMNTGEVMFSPSQINSILGKIIEKKIFYNLCKISIIEDLRGHERIKTHEKSCEWGKTSSSRIREIHEQGIWRGFEEEQIELIKDVTIQFVYPIISKQIFRNIFEQKKKLIKARLGNIIATNVKNADIAKFSYEIDLQNKKLEKLAFYDTETGLPNENKLRKDLSSGDEETLALIEIADYATILGCQWGIENWLEILRQVAEYLSHEFRYRVYQYDKMTFCIRFPTEKIQKASWETEKNESTTYNMIESVLANFNIKFHQSLQFHVGLVIWKKNHHIKYAHIALIKAKHYRAKSICIFQEGDERASEEAQQKTDLFATAIDRSDESTYIIPHYQPIYNPKKPEMKKVEALARIERILPDGSMKIFAPNNFMDIATNKKRLAEITLAMLSQIRADMKKDTTLIVSINIHEQDWNDYRVMAAFRSLNLSLSNRIYIEILETVPFDRAEDIQKIQELKSLGFKISIDDYGTNRGNLNKLILIDPNNIKIDGDIIKNLHSEVYRNNTIAAIRSIVSHAREIGATVTAERIESEKVFHLLQDLGVDFFQWYYFAKPVPFDQLPRERLKNKI